MNSTIILSISSPLQSHWGPNPSPSPQPQSRLLCDLRVQLLSPCCGQCEHRHAMLGRFHHRVPPAVAHEPSDGGMGQNLLLVHPPFYDQPFMPCFLQEGFIQTVFRILWSSLSTLLVFRTQKNLQPVFSIPFPTLESDLWTSPFCCRSLCTPQIQLADFPAMTCIDPCRRRRVEHDMLLMALWEERAASF
ncbi:uncharacterized protein J3R85_006927 [Psidium guajava]|nr:uncharacterized protein J3R85_006927 [Psidium guajava]